MIQRKVGERIRKVRLSKKLSQEQCALSTNLDRTYWSSVECGKRNISINNLNKICNFFNFTLKDFFDSDIFIGE